MKDFEDEFYQEDGWNGETLADTGLMDLISDFDRMGYEITSCVRGYYGISGNTVEDLRNDLIQMQERLEEIIKLL
jgi:hypothetical protein